MAQSSDLYISRRVLLQSTAAMLASTAFVQTAANAQAVVERVHFVVAFQRGASFDKTSRAAQAALLASGLSKNVTVENIEGRGGAVAIEHLRDRSVDNSNTLMMAGSSMMLRNLIGIYPYKLSDLALVVRFSVEPLTFAVKDNSRFRSVGDVVAALKADPRSVSFCADSVPGLTEHLCVAKMCTKAGIAPKSVTYIPKPGGHADVIGAVVAGEADVMVIAAADVLESRQNKSVRVLAVSSDKRVDYLPDVPTLAEAGVPDAVFYNSRGFFMAPGTDPAKITAMGNLLEKMVATPEWERERVKGEVTMLFARLPEGQEFFDGVQREMRGLLAALGIPVVN